MKYADRIFAGAAGLAIACTAVLSVSGLANGYEVFRHNASTAASKAVDTRLLVAQASGTPVSFSSEQADRGETQYKKDCVECHGDDLRGGLLGGPPLRGVNFLNNYGNGQPAGMLYDVMSATMPPDSPGRYSPGTYADMMAYILKRNGFPAGSQPLPSDVDALYNMIIE